MSVGIKNKPSTSLYLLAPPQELFLFIEIFKIKAIAHQFTLVKNERLKSRKLIEQLFNEGQSFSYFPLKVLYLFPEKGPDPVQAGFAVSARNLKKQWIATG